MDNWREMWIEWCWGVLDAMYCHKFGHRWRLLSMYHTQCMCFTAVLTCERCDAEIHARDLGQNHVNPSGDEGGGETLYPPKPVPGSAEKKELKN